MNLSDKAKQFWSNINNYFLQKKIDKQMSNGVVNSFIPENVEKVNNNLDQMQSQEISLESPQSWNPETHPEGIGPSKAISSIHWKDGILDWSYTNNPTKKFSEVVDENTAKEFVSADSKGRWAQANLNGGSQF